jgi:hypothetical protein
MSPTSYQTAPPRNSIIATARGIVKLLGGLCDPCGSRPPFEDELRTWYLSTASLPQQI